MCFNKFHNSDRQVGKLFEESGLEAKSGEVDSNVDTEGGVWWIEDDWKEGG